MTNEEHAKNLDRLAKCPPSIESYDIPALIARIRELEALTEWRPIESAPKDGTRVMLWIPTMAESEQLGRWDVDEYATKPKPRWTYRSLWGVKAELRNQPTHWRPLSAGPKEKS